MSQHAGPDPAAIAKGFEKAIELALDRCGATAPNPPVGCVLLDSDGRVLAAAAHQRAGEAHAEVLALELCRQNGSYDRIDTVLVTLEPCTHSGRTPPCSAALLASPARRVWVGTRDPNPQVRGGGMEVLAAAGLSVQLIADLPASQAPHLAAICARPLAPFGKWVRTGVPWVTVKQALTRAGSMVPPAGHTTFTDPASLTMAHQLRKEADAVLTGSGTILADDPAFTVRLVQDFPEKRRQLVIMDRRRRVPQTYVDDARARGFGVSIHADLREALTHLGSSGCLEVLVEAGPALTRAVLQSGQWDEHVLIQQAARDGAPDKVLLRSRAGDAARIMTSPLRHDIVDQPVRESA